MLYIILTGCFLVSLAFGWIIIPRILLISHKKRLFDLPDQRKIHSSPVPRLGGLSFFPAILISFSAVMGLCIVMQIDIGASTDTVGRFLLIAAGAMILFTAGAADDLIGLTYQAKFAFQFAAAGLLVLTGERIGYSMPGILPPWADIVLTILIVVYIINAINLIDGVDGLASGLSAISLTVITVLSLTCSQYAYAMLALSVLGPIIPFWFYNVFGSVRRGHKLFMGDTGSLVLGYQLAFLTIHTAHGVDDVVFRGDLVVMSFSPLIIPIFDVIRVVIRRLRTGHHPFKPDKNHFHHKLLRTGLGEHHVMALMLALASLFVLMNYFLSRSIDAIWILLADSIIWILLHLYFNWLIHSRPQPEEKE